ncbi:MAG: hypothetical protein WAU65_01025 [Candidatus Nanoarchaeia archaeon]
MKLKTGGRRESRKVFMRKIKARNKRDKVRLVKRLLLKIKK